MKKEIKKKTATPKVCEAITITSDFHANIYANDVDRARIAVWLS